VRSQAEPGNEDGCGDSAISIDFSGCNGAGAPTEFLRIGDERTRLKPGQFSYAHGRERIQG